MIKTLNRNNNPQIHLQHGGWKISQQIGKNTHDKKNVKEVGGVN